MASCLWFATALVAVGDSPMIRFRLYICALTDEWAPEKRVALLQETGIDAYAFEVADILAWICQASTALRVGGMGDGETVLGSSIAQRLKYEICPFCDNAICTCDLELETEERKTAYRFLE